eukprot:GGOE01041398.1.p1 GENE.GGOE01041398.1~~GGOE01041398.1.p1  ORF type:complete len:348 (+),score=88.99 GGOE01041398.1:70-1044(+)
MASADGFKRFFQGFSEGLLAGVQAGARTAQSESFKVLVKKYARVFFQMFVVIYTVVFILWLPFGSILGLLDAVTGAGMSSRVPGPFTLMCKVSETLGPLVLLALNYKSVAISDEFFFGQLVEVSPDQARRLQRMPFPSPGELVKGALKRWFRFASVAFVVFLISLLPGGPMFRKLAEAGFNFYLMFRLFGSVPVAATVGVLRMVPDESLGVPIGGWYVTAMVKMFVLAQSVYRESLDPYLSRVHCALKHQPRQKDQKQLKCVEVDGIMLSTISRHDQPRFLGFAFPFAFLMSLPLVGPVAMLFSLASAAHLAQPLLNDSSRRRR